MKPFFQVKTLAVEVPTSSALHEQQLNGLQIIFHRARVGDRALFRHHLALASDERRVELHVTVHGEVGGELANQTRRLDDLVHRGMLRALARREREHRDARFDAHHGGCPCGLDGDIGQLLV